MGVRTPARLYQKASPKRTARCPFCKHLLGKARQSWFCGRDCWPSKRTHMAKVGTARRSLQHDCTHLPASYGQASPRNEHACKGSGLTRRLKLRLKPQNGSPLYAILKRCSKSIRVPAIRLGHLRFKATPRDRSNTRAARAMHSIRRASHDSCTKNQRCTDCSNR